MTPSKTLSNKYTNQLFSVSRSTGMVFLLALMTLTLASCGGGSDGGNTPGNGNDDPDNGSSFNQSQLISNVASIMRTDYAKLGSSVTTLNISIDQYCSDLNHADVQARRTTAQSDFKVVMDNIQHSLLQRMGPALIEDRLLQLYSWPLSGPCAIDKKLAANELQLNLAANRRGIDAIEYLLFVDPAADHSCPTGAQPISELAAFNGLSTADKQSRRCGFMKNVIADASVSATVLADAWDTSKGNYTATMTSNNNTKEVLNLVTDGMYYLRDVSRKEKLDGPLGGIRTQVTPSCGEGTLCPQDVESPHARISKENLLANALAFQTLYHGGTDATAQLGFDDWLVAEDKADLATSFTNDIQAVIDGFSRINGSLFDAVTSQTTELNALLDLFQKVSQDLRESVIPALGLKVPAAQASDTD